MILDTDAPPFLMVQGSIDDDTRGQGIKAYDADVAEGQGERSSDKVALWLYGATHRAFGGGTAFGGDRLGKTQADAVAPYYIEQFLRWQLFADQDAREQILVLTSPDAAQSDYPASIWDPTLWTVDGTVAGDPDIAVFYEGDGGTLDGIGRPLVFADYQQGTIEVGAERLVIDNLERSTTVADCDGAFGASTLGGDVTVSAIGSATGFVSVCQGPAEQLQPDAGFGAKHESSALRLGWGLDTPGIEVAWDLRDADGLALRTAADYTHLSIRVGNLIESCPPTTDEVELEIELEFESADGSLVNRTVTTGILPDQHGQDVILAGTNGSTTGCATSQFMRTVRIPLTDFCDQGMTTVDGLTTLRVSALPSTTDHIVQIDSVELTRDPDAASPVSCPQSRFDWACVATGVLAPQEAGCAGEPIAGACDPQDTTVTAVATPVVDPGPSSFAGWVVHTPKGWVGDGENPTSAELDEILGLCVGACEREWDGVSPISANCDDPGAFVTPTRRAAPGPGTTHRIKQSERDGSGIVSGLGCDLLSDCCAQFDEDLCAAAPLRMTSARQPLGRGEEYRIALGGSQTKARFLTPSGAVNMPLVGEAGYSLFEGPTGPGAFYLGSLSASGTSAVTVTDTCPDGSPFSHQVTDLDLELVQPAFAAGKAPPSKAKIFPAGALHIIGTITVDGTTYTVRSLTEKRVYVRVDGGDVFTGWMDINFSAPCGDSILPVTLRLILADQTLLDQKPVVTLTTPATIQCPTSITLTATASDADGDLDSVRYYLDDVLLDASVSSVSITADHTIKVTARDLRGATATDTKAIVCL